MKLSEAKKRLRQRYVDGMPAKILAIESALESSDEAGEEALRRMAHQIRGSAASFGFPGLGSKAEATELAAAGELREKAQVLLACLRELTRSDSHAPHRVLLVDDDRLFAHAVRDTLNSESVDVSFAESLAEASALVDSHKWDLIMLDLKLPDGDGRALLARMRRGNDETPVFVVSALDDALAQNECSAYGIERFLHKPLNFDTLPNVVTASCAQRKTLHREIYKDELTGADNRSGFRKTLAKTRQDCRRQSEGMCVAILDLDHFKSFNDTYGHSAGDDVLLNVARTLKSTLRTTDNVGRWGGEEFVVALFNTDLSGAQVALEKAADALRMVDAPRTITFSAGLVELGDDLTLDAALLEADKLLYAAKDAGRDRIVTKRDAPEVAARPSILLVEDDHDVAALICAELADGYEVVHVDHGTAALKAAEDSSFGLYLLDQDLPGASGIEITERLRARRSSGNAPIIMLTASASDDLLEKSFAAGASDFVTKPVGARELKARIARYLPPFARKP